MFFCFLDTFSRESNQQKISKPMSAHFDINMSHLNPSQTAEFINMHNITIDTTSELSNSQAQSFNSSDPTFYV